MPFPSISDRVRVSGRDGEFIIVRVHPSAPFVDLCAVNLCDPDGPAIIERDVPVDRLIEPVEIVYKHSDADIEQRLLRASETLETSRVHLAASHTVLADLHDLLNSTQHLIRSSQERIQESDRTIARARGGVSPWNPPTE